MEEQMNVSQAAMESAMMHLQKANQRLAVIAGLAVLVMALMFGVFMYFLTDYEISSEQITIDSHEGTANYVSNDGDIINGRDQSQEDYNQEKEQ